jgi:hypothetical protein
VISVARVRFTLLYATDAIPVSLPVQPERKSGPDHRVAGAVID